MPHTTKHLLLTAFTMGLPITLRAVQFMVLNKIERESGDNQSYNVTGITTTGESATVFVRTVD